MTKTTLSITVDSYIYEVCRSAGMNISAVCETALASQMNVVKEQPDLFGLFTSSDDDVKFLNKMIHRCAQGFPGFCKTWADMLKSKYVFIIDYYELYKLCKEQME